MAEKDKGTNARLKLEITEVQEPKDIGKERTWMMLEFKAKLEGEDKAHTYKAFTEKFFGHIKAGETIDCDVNITKNTFERDGEPVTFTNRKVVQIYIDGQPVNVRPSGGGRYQDSPETRASIESQKRADIIAQLYIAGKLGADHPLIDKLFNWLLKLGEATPNAPQPSPETRQPTSKAKAEDLVDEPLIDGAATTRTKLLAKVKRAHGWKEDKTAIKWLHDVKGIEVERIDNEPGKVLRELEEAK